MYAVAALVAGLTAMLVKPTTAALWIVPLLAYTAATERPGWRSWIRDRREPVLVAIIVVPFLAALAWTAHADAIKAANPGTAWLTSARLSTWNFGTFEQRLVWENWTTVLGRITGAMTGYPALLLPLTSLVALRSRQARFWVAVVAVAVLTVLCFWNLYVVHDYYLAAISPVPAAVAGMAFAGAWRWAATARARRLFAQLLGTSVAAMVLLNAGYSTIAYRHASADNVLPELPELALVTLPSDLLVFEGYDWEPALPYYARRSGHMTGPDGLTTAADLTAEGYRLLVSRRIQGDLAVDLVRSGRWTGVLGAWTYITGEQRADLRGAPIAATDDLSVTGPSLLNHPLTVACGQDGVALPHVGGTTVVRLAAETSRNAKLTIAAGRGPERTDERAYGDIPVRRYLVVDAGLDGPLVVSCRDADSVTMEMVTSHPPGTL